MASVELRRLRLSPFPATGQGGGTMSATATSQGKRGSGSVGVEPIGFRLLGLGLFLLVLLILGTAAVSGSQHLPTSIGELFLWTALVAAASVVPLTSRDGPSLVIDLPVLLGAGFLFGPVFAGFVGLIGCVDIREFRREVSVSRALLNRAQISLSVMVAALVFQGIGGQLGVWPWAAFAGLLALTADCVVNYSLVALATSLLNRRPILDVLGEMSVGQFVDVHPGVCLPWIPGRPPCRDVRPARISRRGWFRSTTNLGSSGIRYLASSRRSRGVYPGEERSTSVGRRAHR